MKKGIDVSRYQGNVDWAKVKASGIEFAIIRAGFGANSIDGKFKRNADECTRLGIPFGVYWFSYALNETGAKKEAKSCLKACEGYKLDYGIWFDFEYDSVSYMTKKGIRATKPLASNIARAFMNEVKAAGIHTGNYTNLDYSKRMFDKDILENYDMWAARYTSKQTDIAKTAGLWQYSSKGKVKGIIGNVDMDYAVKTYPQVDVKPTTESVDLVPGKDTYGIPSIYNLVFDPAYYYKTYKDLQDAVKVWIDAKVIKNDPKDIAWQLYQHFLMFGMEEARIAIPTFDVKKYKAEYPDLREAFGDDSYKPYYYHYMQFGANEIATGQRRPFMK